MWTRLGAVFILGLLEAGGALGADSAEEPIAVFVESLTSHPPPSPVHREAEPGSVFLNTVPARDRLGSTWSGLDWGPAQCF